MIKAVFYKCGKLIDGFNLKGHSTANEDDEEGRLVCSAVSSATIMATNTITDIIGDNAKIETKDGFLLLNADNADKCSVILDGLWLHLTELEKEYPERIKVIMEVRT